jgi:monofunctional biosynthetic peptidoglycan transglycosylase
LRRLFHTLGRILLAVAALWLLLAVAYRWLDPPGTPLMLLRWPTVARIDYRPVSSARLAPALAEAVIASEDQAFCLHHGVDFNQVGDALHEFESRGRLRGASTITMQTARNLFLWPGGGIFRKALEVPLAFLLEALMPKHRIMTLYLDIIEWGDGTFGAEAAAEHYFRKDAARLDRREAALLAAVLPNPNRMSPLRPSAYVRERAAIIEGRMGRLEGLTGCLRGEFSRE